MEPLDYLKAVARRWRIVLACVALTAAGAFASAPAAQEAPTPSGLVSYTATASILADPTVEQNLAYTKLFMERGALPEEVADALGTGQSGPEVAATVTIEQDDSVGMLAVSSAGGDPEAVEKLVNTYADVSIAYFDEEVTTQANDQLAVLQPRLERSATNLAQLDTEVADDPGDGVMQAQRAAMSSQYEALLGQVQEVEQRATETSGLSVLEYGTALREGAATLAPPSSASQRLLLGLAVGGLLGALLALAVDRFDTRVRSRQQTQEITSTPVLAEVPRLSRVARRRTVPPVLCEPGGAFAESHRALRSALTLVSPQSLGNAHPGREGAREAVNRVVLVVSGRAGEGKSTTVVNLAATIAATGRTVVVVDADLRRPSLGRVLGVPTGQGLSDLASPEHRGSASEVASLLRRTRVEGVRLLDAGSPEKFTSVSPTRMVDVIRQLRHAADVVLVDVAPLLGASDALDLVAAVDSALVVVRSGRTTSEQLRHTREVLERTQVPVLGTVLVGVPGPPSRRFGTSSEGLGRMWGTHRRTTAPTRELVSQPAGEPHRPRHDKQEDES